MFTASLPLPKQKVLLGLFLFILVFSLWRCGGSGPDGQSYNFSKSASGSLGMATFFLDPFSLVSPVQSISNLQSVDFRPSQALGTGPTLCSSVICFTPSKLTGAYYGTGFLIQSSGSGMMAYFGQTNWSSITGTSTSYSFDTSAPITNTGNLNCCSGTGNLSSSNTYISDVAYLFGYLDATFTVSGVTSNTNMNREFTVRFVLANGAISGGIRGDVLLKDPGDSVFKWMDTSVSAGGDIGAGTLVTTRPTTPVTMNTSVKNYTNPFGTGKGNDSIPVIYAAALPQSGSGVFTTSESALNTADKTYTFSFDSTKFVMFPTLLTADINSLSTYYQLMSLIHLGGLPHSTQSSGVGSPSGTILTVTP